MATAHEIHRRLERLAEDTGPLGRVAGLGAVADAAVVDDVIAGAAAWVVVDGRADEDHAAALTRALSSKRPLLMVLPMAVSSSSPLVDCVQAIADQRAMQGGHRWTDGRFAVTLVVGAEHFEQVPTSLQRVDFWEFCV